MAPTLERPETVPEEAEYHDNKQQWDAGNYNAESQRNGKWRTWNLAGELIEEAEYELGHYHGLVKTFEKGNPHSVSQYRKGIRSGPFQGIVLRATYADSRIRIERGNIEGDISVGSWSFHDHKGKMIAKTDFGVLPTSDKGLLDSEAFNNRWHTAQEWSEISRNLLRDHRVAEAVCALARAAASEQRTDALDALLERTIVPLSETATLSLTDALISEPNTSLTALSHGLIRGAEPGAIFHTLAVALDQGTLSRAAMDLVNTAILLHPDRHQYHYTRALINISLGNRDAAKMDTEILEPAEPDKAQFLSRYLGALFPVYDFWPAQTKLTVADEAAPLGPQQDLAAVQEVLQKYATRLTYIRQALGKKIGERPDWLPPTLSHLLPDGPVELRVFETDAGSSGDSIMADESFDAMAWEVPTLLRFARADWSALTWLCWSTGLDSVEIPTQIEWREHLATALQYTKSFLENINQASAKKDLQITVHWEGQALSSLHPVLSQIAETQFQEMQAMFLWLTNTRHQSPWQEDLRQVNA